MTEATIQAGFTDEAFHAVAARETPGWLAELRQSAYQRFCELPMPARTHEEWMRTDIRLLHLDRFGLPAPPPADTAVPQPLLAEGLELAGHLASLDSHPTSHDLDPKWRAKGVLFGSLEEMVAEHGELLRPHLERRAVDPGYDKFSALSAAFWSGGTLLYVPAGVHVSDPLHAAAATTDGGVDLGRTLVVLEEGAEATLLAESLSTLPSGGGLHCGTVELFVGPAAQLRYVSLQNWGAGMWHFAHQTAFVDRDARLQWTIGALGSRLAKVNQHVAMTGPGADVEVNGVMFTQGKQHLSYHTLQHHRAPACQSNLLYKAALQDQSRTVWRGMIQVDPDAQKTNGYQRNDNLMLSATSRADSIPGLQIEADDVRCTHGSTSGRVDQQQIFYFQSRGLSRNEAVRMIVAGFFQQIFDRITIEPVREVLGYSIGRRIRETV